MFFFQSYNSLLPPAAEIQASLAYSGNPGFSHGNYAMKIKKYARQSCPRSPYGFGKFCQSFLTGWVCRKRRSYQTHKIQKRACMTNTPFRTVRFGMVWIPAPPPQQVPAVVKLKTLKISFSNLQPTFYYATESGAPGLPLFLPTFSIHQKKNIARKKYPCPDVISTSIQGYFRFCYSFILPLQK